MLALPRGGVPVAVPVAAALDAPLDVLVVRKLGLPGQPELAMGAVAVVAGQVETVLEDRVLRDSAVPPEVVERVRAREVAELLSRDHAYRSGRPAPAVQGRTVVLVDDGLATGSTVRAAVAALRRADASRVVVAVPVGPRSACRRLAEVADEVVCLQQPDPFHAVGQAYRDFGQVPEDEVLAALARHRGEGV